jgi:hypothetical protein
MPSAALISVSATGADAYVDFWDAQTKTIGGLEVLAAVGLVLPSVLNVALLLSAAAGGLVRLMIRDRDARAAGRNRSSRGGQLVHWPVILGTLTS